MPFLIVKISNRRTFTKLHKLDDVKIQKMKIIHINNGPYHY